jgi:hypothetical protein
MMPTPRLGPHPLGDQRAEHRERRGDLEAREDEGQRARQREFHQPLPAGGGEHVEQLVRRALDGAEPAGHADQERKETGRGRDDDMERHAAADEDDEDRGHGDQRRAVHQDAEGHHRAGRPPPGRADPRQRRGEAVEMASPASVAMIDGTMW